MAAEWPTATVSELERDGVLLVQDGNHGASRPTGDEIVSQGIPHVRALDIRPDGSIDLAGAQKVSETAWKRIKKGRSGPGDVLLTHKGTVGRVAVVPAGSGRVLCSPQTTFWRSLDEERLCQGFVSAFLRSGLFRTQLRRVMHETDMAPYVSLTSQRAMHVPLPPVGYQRSVASILEALDDKIESNVVLDRLLGEVCQAHFDRQFGDVLNGGTAILTDYAQVRMGHSPRGATYSESDDGSGMLLVQGMGGFGNRFPFHNQFTSAPLRTVPAGSPLMTVRAPVGAINVASRETCIGRGVAGFVTDRPCFIEGLLRSIESRGGWKAYESGTIYSAVNRGQVENLPLGRADLEVIEDYEAFATPLVRLRSVLHREIGALTAMRDAVLPKLISGQIRVPLSDDVEEQMGAAVEALT
jgi:type I restriction enzyme S subunit